MPWGLNQASWQTLQFTPFWEMSLQVQNPDDAKPSRAQLDVFFATVAEADSLPAGLWRDVLLSIGPAAGHVFDEYLQDSREIKNGLATVFAVVRGHAPSEELDFLGSTSRLAFRLVRSYTTAPWDRVPEHVKTRLVMGACGYIGLAYAKYGAIVAEFGGLDDPILGLQGQVRQALGAAASAYVPGAAPGATAAVARFCSSCGGRAMGAGRFCAACGAPMY